jgi:hypothetical protein
MASVGGGGGRRDRARFRRCRGLRGKTRAPQEGGVRPWGIYRGRGAGPGTARTAASILCRRALVSHGHGTLSACPSGRASSRALVSAITGVLAHEGSLLPMAPRWHPRRSPARPPQVSGLQQRSELLTYYYLFMVDHDRMKAYSHKICARKEFRPRTVALQAPSRPPLRHQPRSSVIRISPLKPLKPLKRQSY